MLGEDLGMEGIAYALGIAVATVKWYRAEALRKLGVRTTAAAVAIIVRIRLGVPA